MSKNITIAEGSQAKNFNTVHKLRTNLIGGGTQYWVPEDEAGAYANMGQKSITANGTYRASDDNKDGFSQVTVNVPPTTPRLITKSITENGVYNASDDDADGYRQITVGVAKMAVGTDGMDDGGDGNEHYIYTDPNTKLLKNKTLPSEIQVLTPPNKTVYYVGESIDLTGLQVRGICKNGVVWEDEGYPNGIIPNSELIISPKQARTGTNSGIWTDGDGVTAIQIEILSDGICYDYIGDVLYPSSPKGWYTILLGKKDRGEATLLATKYEGTLYLMRTSGENPGCDIYVMLPKEEGLKMEFWGGTSGGTRMNVWEPTGWDDRDNMRIEVPESTKDPRYASEMGTNLCKITVKWKRPYDHKTLSTYFSVQVH